MVPGTIITRLVLVTVISSLAYSEQYGNSDRNRLSPISESLIDPNSYFPDPPVIGLMPPSNGNLVPRIDRSQERRSRPRPRPRHTSSRFRNNFGKGKRMRRPPGPFKVVGQKKTCTYKRKLVQAPKRYERRSDLGANLVYKDSPRNGRTHVKRNLLVGHDSYHPMNYYRNLPSQSYSPASRSSVVYPSRSSSYSNAVQQHQQPLKRFYRPIKSDIVRNLDLNNYRIFIHQYSYDSDESGPPMNSQQGRPTLKKHRSMPGSPYRPGNNYNLLNHKTNLGPKVLPASVNKPPQQQSTTTKSRILGQVKDWKGQRPMVIVRSHLDRFENTEINKEIKRPYSSAIRVPDNGQTMTVIKPTLIRKATAPSVTTGLQSTNSSHVTLEAIERRESSLKAVPRSTTEHPDKGSTMKPSRVNVIYVTPEPYTGEWSTGVGSGGVLRMESSGEESMFANVRAEIKVSSPEHSYSVAKGGVFMNPAPQNDDSDQWRPIHPDSEDINRWFKTVPITPNKDWVELQKK